MKIKILIILATVFVLSCQNTPKENTEQTETPINQEVLANAQKVEINIEEENINRTPSAGLEENQTDEKDLGYSYNELEPAIRKCLYELQKVKFDYGAVVISETETEELKFVWRRHLLNKHKHEALPVVKIRKLTGMVV